MIRLAALAVAAVALAGCTKATEIRGPNGQTAQLIECNGAVQGFGACFERANEVCPAGYNLVNSNQSVGGAIIGVHGGSQPTNRHIIVQCAG